MLNFNPSTREVLVLEDASNIVQLTLNGVALLEEPITQLGPWARV